MPKGILETIGLALTLVFAIPVALLGVQFLVFDGRPVFGVAFLLIALLMVAVEEYLTTPTDLPGMVLGRTVETVVENPSENDDAPADPVEPEDAE